jgi:hypothetical protein
MNENLIERSKRKYYGSIDVLKRNDSVNSLDSQKSTTKFIKRSSPAHIPSLSKMLLIKNRKAPKQKVTYVPRFEYKNLKYD